MTKQSCVILASKSLVQWNLLVLVYMSISCIQFLLLSFSGPSFGQRLLHHIGKTDNKLSLNLHIYTWVDERMLIVELTFMDNLDLSRLQTCKMSASVARW